MTADNGSLLERIRARLFPRMPDFYRLLGEQCELLEAGTAALQAYMAEGSAERAAQVAATEHAADVIKKRNLDILQRAFATPFDREDVYRAIVAIDEILNYAKSTVREMEALRLPPDEHTLEMATLLDEGAQALTRGFAALARDPAAAEAAADQARKTERNTEKVYRRAVAELFDASHYLESQTSAQREDAAALDVLTAPLGDAHAPSVATGIAFVLEVLKRREVYRHMSNASDRVAHAGDVLHDIVVKLV